MQHIDLLNGFSNIYSNSIRCIKEVCTNTNYSLNIKNCVITYSFLYVYTEWESFLEQSFISYTLGNRSINGNTPICYISPQNEEHADKLIKGAATYPDWSTCSKVIMLSENIFENGEPFKSALSKIASQLDKIKKIRNAISHNSTQSQDAFNSLIRNEWNASKTGISVADFLIGVKGRQDPFYKLYFDYIIGAARKISNF